jgi:SHS family lactate transporter-like MFS transporter
MADHYAAEKATEESQVENQLHESPHHQRMSAGEYLATRFSTLKPPMNKAPNPFKLVMMLNKRQWAFFFVGFIAWVYSLLKITVHLLTRGSHGMPSISSP